MKLIEDYLPHRKPFLFINKFISVDIENKAAICESIFTKDDQVFLDHFPNNPIVPGVLIIEAAAQASIILLKELNFVYNFYYLLSVNDCTFKASAKPDDVLIIKTKLINYKLGIFKSETEVFNNDKLICKLSITCKASNEKI
jgi:3-hydroxymyristoyl/3-hydroxydecanoyl-(acyl carrier protein) dehydratase